MRTDIKSLGDEMIDEASRKMALVIAGNRIIYLRRGFRFGFRLFFDNFGFFVVQKIVNALFHVWTSRP
jgi:hypothetical protein